jgi:hypothetical protein
MAAIQSFLARASMKTLESFEKLKEDAEKSFGIEVSIQDPILKELQSFIVEEEFVLEQIRKMTNEFMESVNIFSKRDSLEFVESMKGLLENRATDEQRYRITDQLDEYKAIREETTMPTENSVSTWVIVELQTNVLTGIDKELKKFAEVRKQFWKLKELKRHCTSLGKIANVDKKSKDELAIAMKDAADTEKELFDMLIDMKEIGVMAIDNIWNEYCRIEAEYFSRMNDAYLEPPSYTGTPTQPKPKSAKKVHQKPVSPVIVAESEDDADDTSRTTQ